MDKEIIDTNTFLPEEKEEKSRYEKKRLSRPIYELCNLSQNKAVEDKISGASTITQGRLIVDLCNFAKLPKSSPIVLNMVSSIANEQGLNRESVTFHIDEYIKRFNLKCGRKEAVKKLKRELDIFLDTKFTYEDDKSFSKVIIIYTYNYNKKGGYVTVFLNSIYRNMLKKASAVDMLKGAEAIDCNKYPNAYGVFNYVYDMIFQENDGNNGRLLSVHSLLKNTFSYLPTEEKVKDQDASYKYKIIVPFIDTLEYLEKLGFFTWKWKGAKGRELTAKEKEDIDSYNYNAFKNAFIYFKFPEDYPDQTKLIEDRKEKIKEAKECKKTYKKELAKQRAKQQAKSEQN